MNEALSKLLRLKAPLKAAITAGVLVVIGGIYYMLFYSDLAQEITTAERGAAQLKTEKESYEKRKREYLAYREELRKLTEEQRELLKALPKKAEIPSFMSSVQEQAELCGLEVLTMNIDSEATEELYVRIPVRMEVRGSYHTLTRFFKNISELRRIVNIENFAMAVDRSDTDNGPPKLRAKFVAATFRYIDKAGGT
jgi:type IV pilus assembly protein PilO